MSVHTFGSFERTPSLEVLERTPLLELHLRTPVFGVAVRTPPVVLLERTPCRSCSCVHHHGVAGAYSIFGVAVANDS